MLITCPFCQTRYLVAANLFAHGPRQTRCARCSHNWRAEGPVKGSQAEPLPDASAPIAQPTLFGPSALVRFFSEFKYPSFLKIYIPPQYRRIVLIAGAGAALLVVILVLILGRQGITEQWSVTEDFYDTIGLRIYHYGNGLTFGKTRSELVYDSGVMKLAVDGKVNNPTKNVQEIPAIRATAIGPDGNAIQSWQIDPSATRVFPGEAIVFHSSINAPKGAVANVNLRFIGKEGR